MCSLGEGRVIMINVTKGRYYAETSLLPFYYDKTMPETNCGIWVNFLSVNEKMIQVGIERLQTALSRVMR
jgi:hypothetical protein